MNKFLKLRNAMFVALVVFFAMACQNETESVQPEQSQTLNQPLSEMEISQLIVEAKEAEKSNGETNRRNRPVETVDFVDVERYTGRWFELANFPQIFSFGCACTTADYALIEGGVSVSNNCINNGEVSSIQGTALVEESESNAKLSVRLGGSPFPGEYWIIDLAENGSNQPYTFAVVSNSTRSSLFILSRTPQITTLRQKFELVRIFRNLIRQGFNLSKIRITNQSDDCVYADEA